MKISWLQLLRALPGLQLAVRPIGLKDWASSKTLWYQLIKSMITVLSACGLYIVLSAEKIEAISLVLSLAVPTVLTLCDAVFSAWLRTRPTEITNAVVINAAANDGTVQTPPISVVLEPMITQGAPAKPTTVQAPAQTITIVPVVAATEQPKREEWKP